MDARQQSKTCSANQLIKTIGKYFIISLISYILLNTTLRMSEDHHRVKGILQ